MWRTHSRALQQALTPRPRLGRTATARRARLVGQRITGIIIESKAIVVSLEMSLLFPPVKPVGNTGQPKMLPISSTQAVGGEQGHRANLLLEVGVTLEILRRKLPVILLGACEVQLADKSSG